MDDHVTILLAEDDANLGMVITETLCDAGYEVVLCRNGDEALESFAKKKVDLCILDIMMPKRDGFDVAEKIREKDTEIPIIFLTAKSMPEDRIKGFRVGGDDYITKPFNHQELILRIEAILKRSIRKDDHGKDLFEIGLYRFDYRNLELSIGDDKRTLTKKEAELMRLLCVNINSVLNRDVALKMVWGEQDYFLGRSMDVFISRLRKYLKRDGNVRIENVHGVGFKLTIDSKKN